MSESRPLVSLEEVKEHYAGVKPCPDEILQARIAWVTKVFCQYTGQDLSKLQPLPADLKTAALDMVLSGRPLIPLKPNRENGLMVGWVPGVKYTLDRYRNGQID